MPPATDSDETRARITRLDARVAGVDGVDGVGQCGVRELHLGAQALVGAALVVVLEHLRRARSRDDVAAGARRAEDVLGSVSVVSIGVGCVLHNLGLCTTVTVWESRGQTARIDTGSPAKMHCTRC